MDPSPDYSFKVVVVGESGVGKTSILKRFETGEFPLQSHLNLGIVKKMIPVDGKLVSLEIWDTAGQELYRSLTRAYYRSSNGVLIVFDLANRNTYDGVRRWLENSRQNALDNFKSVLVGNKSDLKHDVGCAEAENLAKQLKIDAYIEASAKENLNIQESFVRLAREMMQLSEERRSFKLESSTGSHHSCC